MNLSKDAQEELEYMKRQIREDPDDEAAPSALYDRLSQDEKKFIQAEYARLGGK